jgi:BirA family biotin operon repressor/biotin-[acetyl-CoA-carboxylase] ligase
MSTDLSNEAIERALTGGWGQPTRVHASVGSTNSEALEWAANGAPEGALVVADHQSAGRGRHGRTWIAEPGRALLFSIVLRAPEQSLSLLTTAAGVGVARAVRSTTGLNAGLKWPNDVTIATRKVAGILVETRFTGGRVDAAVAGVGLNLRPPANDLPDDLAERATDITAEMLRAGAGSPPARVDLLVAMIAGLEVTYGLLTTPDGRAEVVTAASGLSEVLGRDVVVRMVGERIVQGRADELGTDGSLLLRTSEGRVAISGGEVELLRTRAGGAA